MRRAEKWMVLATVSAALGGCGGTSVKTVKTVPATARPVAKDASEEDLLEKYRAMAGDLRSLDATTELKAEAGTQYSGVIEDYHEVKAFVLATRPYDVRVIGQVPVVGKTVFDMASDGKSFEVSIPPKNKFLTGPVAVERQSSKPIENLRPQHLVEALLWPEVRKEEAVLFEEFNDENARYYVLTVLRGGYKSEILRRIWFDRADLRMARLQTYGPKGTLVSDVRYADWQPVAAGGAAEYPTKIRIERPHDEYRLDLTISKVTLNETLEAERFAIAAPAGAEVIHVGEGQEKQQP